MSLNEGKENKTHETEVDSLNGSEPRQPSNEPVAPSDVHFEELKLPSPGEGQRPVTRADTMTAGGLDKKKLLLLGGALSVAVLFFVFTAIVGKSRSGQKSLHSDGVHPGTIQSAPPPKGSVTPLMETPSKPSPESTGGQLSPEDIKRARPGDGGQIAPASTGKQKPATPTASNSPALSSVPAFSDTQQRWEEPRPYADSSEKVPAKIQQQNSSLKEASLVFVRTQAQNIHPVSLASPISSDEEPELLLSPGTRIQAKLKTAISSAVPTRVVAEIEYTYAIGDQIVAPAGAKVYGQLQHADRSGNVYLKFDEIEVNHSSKQKIDAIGTGLDLGPIKGTVSGKNTGKNFVIRAASGIGSVAATLVGNNASASFSEEDLLRERLAQNIGNAGDSELLNLNANSNEVVSVAADTKIYIVFQEHEKVPSELHRIASDKP